MSDNLLSNEQIMELTTFLKNSPEEAYVNIGVNMSGDTVEIFKPSNYETLIVLFLNSPELLVSDSKVTSMKNKFSKSFDDMENDNTNINTKIGKLCSAFIFVKKKNWAPVWRFYRIPERYRTESFLRYNLVETISSPIVNMSSVSPAVYFQQTNVNTPTKVSENSTNSIGKARKSKHQKKQLNTSYKNSPIDTLKKNNNFRNSPIVSREHVNLFGNQMSSFSTSDFTTKSEVVQPSIRESKLDSIRSRKNSLINLVSNSIKSIPHTKITCNKTTGKCTFELIDSEEHFETSTFNYCLYHTHASHDDFGTISENVRTKISGPYGFFTKSSDCYDSCHVSFSSNLNGEELNEIESKRKDVSKILLSVESNINDFNSMIASSEVLANEKKQNEQHENVTLAEFVNALGDNADKNVGLLQTITINELFKKICVNVRIGRKRGVEFVFPKLSIMNHKSLSSFFKNIDNITESLDIVNFSMRLNYNDEELEFEIPKIAQSLILNNIKKSRDNITSVPCELSYHNGKLQLNINNQPIVFYLRTEASEISRIISGSSDISEFQPTLVNFSILPKYILGTYRSSVFMLGTNIARENGVYESIKDNYEILSNIGVCSISRFSIFNDFTFADDFNNDFSIVNSILNKYEINIDNINGTIESLNEGIENSEDGFVLFEIEDSYGFKVSMTIARAILKQLEDIPTINESGNMIFNGLNEDYSIPFDKIINFIDIVQKGVNSLSNKSLFEIAEEERRVKKEKNNQNSSVMKTGIMVDTPMKLTLDNLNKSNESLSKSETDSVTAVTSIFDNSWVTFKDKTKSVKKPKRRGMSSAQSEAGTVISGITEGTTFSELSSSLYDRTYFNEMFTVILNEGEEDEIVIEMSGFDAEHLVMNYNTVKYFDIQNNLLKILIDKIPINEENMNYILSILYEEDDDLFESFFDEDGELIDKKVAILNILFSSKVKQFEHKGDKFELKKNLNMINPLKSRQKVDFAIPINEAAKGKLLNKFMKNMEVIDKTAYLARKFTIETLGNDLFNSIFSGYQITNGESYENVNGNNKEPLINTAGDILRTRSLLTQIYEHKIKTFIQKISGQDSINGKISSFHFEFGEYQLFSKSQRHEGDYDLIIPSNPMFATENNIDYTSVFPDDFDTFENTDFKLTPIETTIASSDLIDTFGLLFNDEVNVTLNKANSNSTTSFNNPRYSRQMLKIGFMKKFLDIKNIFKFSPDDMEAFDDIDRTFSELSDGISSGEIATNKEKGNLPKGSKLDEFITDIESIILGIFDVNNVRTFKGRSYNLTNLYKAYVNSFGDLTEFFTQRRLDMRDYTKHVISSMYDVKVNRHNEIVRDHIFSSFEDIEENTKDATQRRNPNDVDVYGRALINIQNIIETLNINKIDSSLQVMTGFPLLSLSDRMNVFNKFSDILLGTVGEQEFNAVKKSIFYYFSNNFDKKLYDDFIFNNYEFIMSGLDNNCSLGNFKESQASIFNDIELMDKIKTKKINAYNNLNNTNNLILALSNKIDSEKTLLIDRFIEYVSIIDTIVESYKNQKKSYGSEDHKFKELIDNITIQLNSVKKSYSNVNNFDVKIILMIFENNYEIYKIRKNFYKDFRYDDFSIFDTAILGSIDFIKTYSKFTFVEQRKILNDKISKYGLNIRSNISDLENVTSQMSSKLEASDLAFLFFKCKFSYQIFTRMNIEIDNIKYSLSNETIDEIIIPNNSEYPKIDSYGDILNVGIKGKSINKFTNDNVKILSKLCYQIVDTIDRGLKVIDSGPGMHLLSDSLDIFIDLIRHQKAGNENGSIILFEDFKVSFTKFLKFSDNSVTDIVQSSEFRVFVDVISGKLELLDSVKNSIYFYNQTPNPYTVYDDITSNFVSGILLTMNKLSTMSYQSLDNILENISTTSNKTYSYDNLELFIVTLGDFNKSIVSFIDEYVTESGDVINDKDVKILRQTYNLKTRGEHMNRMFEKLNFCIRKYIKDQNIEFEKRIIEKFTIYIELFFGKFKTLKTLEKYMIKK